MAFDNGTHFPVVGKQFSGARTVRAGRVGHADAMLFSTAIWLILPSRTSCAHWPPIDRLPHDAERAIVYYAIRHSLVERKLS
jgi:hypothetical protein